MLSKRRTVDIGQTGRTEQVIQRVLLSQRGVECAIGMRRSTYTHQAVAVCRPVQLAQTSVSCWTPHCRQPPPKVNGCEIVVAAVPIEQRRLRQGCPLCLGGCSLQWQGRMGPQLQARVAICLHAHTGCHDVALPDDALHRPNAVIAFQQSFRQPWLRRNHLLCFVPPDAQIANCVTDFRPAACAKPSVPGETGAASTSGAPGHLHPDRNPNHTPLDDLLS